MRSTNTFDQVDISQSFHPKPTPVDSQLISLSNDLSLKQVDILPNPSPFFLFMNIAMRLIEHRELFKYLLNKPLGALGFNPYTRYNQGSQKTEAKVEIVDSYHIPWMIEHALLSTVSALCMPMTFRMQSSFGHWSSKLTAGLLNTGAFALRERLIFKYEVRDEGTAPESILSAFKMCLPDAVAGGMTGFASAWYLVLGGNYLGVIHAVTQNTLIQAVSCYNVHKSLFKEDNIEESFLYSATSTVFNFAASMIPIYLMYKNNKLPQANDFTSSQTFLEAANKLFIAISLATSGYLLAENLWDTGKGIFMNTFYTLNDFGHYIHDDERYDGQPIILE